jgi:hypothetical protein
LILWHDITQKKTTKGSLYNQGRCCFEDKHSPIQVTTIENIIEIKISQVPEYRGEMHGAFWFNPNLRKIINKLN